MQSTIRPENDAIGHNKWEKFKNKLNNSSKTIAQQFECHNVKFFSSILMQFYD